MRVFDRILVRPSAPLGSGDNRVVGGGGGVILPPPGDECSPVRLATPAGRGLK